MDLRSGLMRLNARKYYFLSCKSRSFFIARSLSSAPRAMKRNSLLSMGTASDRRCTKLDPRLNIMSYQLRLYSSEAAAHNAENKTEETSHIEEQQENPSAESKKATSPLSKRGERFRNEFLSRIVPWEKIPVSFDNFPYYIDDDTKTLLVECMASHLKHESKFRKYGSILRYSSNRILLQSIPGTELYRERLVSAAARELQVPLLKLDSSILPPYDISHKYINPPPKKDSLDSDRDSDYDHSDEDDSDEDDSDEDYSDEDYSRDERHYTSDKPDDINQLKKGDRVKYVGDTTSIEEAKNRTLSRGNRGEVHEVNGDKVAVIFNDSGLERKEEEKEEEKSTERSAQIITWLEAKKVKLEDDAHVHDCYIAMELLYEVLQSGKPIVVYFPDSFFSSMIEASWTDRNYFFDKAKKMFEKLSGRVVLISGQNKSESKELEKLPDSLKQYIRNLKGSASVSHISDLFTNVMCIKPPKIEDCETFFKQIEEDRATVISQSNLRVMNEVLKAHRILCPDLEQANTTEMILNRWEVEKMVSLATNHHLSTCSHPCVKGDLLHIPHQILKRMISRLKEPEKQSKSTEEPPKKSIKDLAKGEHERELVSAVVCAEDIGVKFDDVGALEHVKKTLFETVILPLKRPELFSHGNLAKPCKGVLLFGPPGTGKTLMAKALATEAGAHFINVTTSTLTSKWVGETERLTRALFSLARKLAPAIIFVDEVDSLLGARGHNKYNTSRLNEFMTAWDGLISKDSQRILVMGATNRPFDLDDAVLRRMPRRVYVGLPDVENRSKILKILLSKENLDPDFSFMQLAQATEGYSGDDLKNLCVAAAYRPIEELIERESKGEKSDGAAALRPLNIEDYLLSKSKVRASVSSDASSIQKLREWDMKYGEGGKVSVHVDGF